MNVPFLAAELLDQTFVARAEVSESLPSTQDRARELCDASSQAPALVVAARQTAGRGREGRSWWSPEGALLFSLVTPFDERRLGRAPGGLISLTAAVAVAELLEQELARCNIDRAVRIKWPNDLYVGDAKIAGLLVDLPHPRPGYRPLAIIGVGFNVNNAVVDAPDDRVAGAVSLREITGQEHDLQAILISLLQKLEAKLHLLTQDRTAAQAAWQSRCYLRGRVVRVAQGEQIIAGKCLGIADDGALLMDVQGQRKPMALYSGTVLELSSN